MTDLEHALDDYQALAAQRGVVVRDYLLAGRESTEDIACALATAGLQAPQSVIEWFQFCGGVVPGSDTAYVFQGRAFNSVEAALAQRTAPQLDDFVIDYTNLIPLTADSPVTLVNLSDGSVSEADSWEGHVPLADSLASWVRNSAKLIPKPGPIPGAREFAPISVGPDHREFDKEATYEVAQVVKHLRPISVNEIWIECAPQFHKAGGAGNEPHHVATLVDQLVQGGIAKASDAIIFEGGQTPEGYHHLTVYFTER